MSELTPYQRRHMRIQKDVESGKLQELVDQGWTLLQLAKKYEVSDNKVRSFSVAYGGPINFNQSTGKKSQINPIDQWSDAKKLALTGRW